MSELKTIEDVKHNSEKELVDAFIKDIEAVYEKHQMRLVNVPAFKLRDDGTFSIIVQTSAGKLPSQQ